jgi:hypothetical protein
MIQTDLPTAAMPAGPRGTSAICRRALRPGFVAGGQCLAILRQQAAGAPSRRPHAAALEISVPLFAERCAARRFRAAGYRRSLYRTYT